MKKGEETVGDEGAQVLVQEAFERLEKKRETWSEKYEEFKAGRNNRMSNFNRVVLMGRLTRDPLIRQTASGKPVADLGLAVTEAYKDKKGEFVEKTCFIDIVAWGRQAETCGEYLKKGSPVLVEGKLHLEQWVAQDGQKRSKHRIQADRVQFLSVGRVKTIDGQEAVHAEKAAKEVEALPF